MATAELFRRVSAVLAAVAGSDLPVDDIWIVWLQDQPELPVQIFVTTSKPGRLIGRRGTTADAVRARLADELAMDVQLNILEAPPHAPPSEPPSEPPSGVREPRRPRPGAPPVGTSLRPPRPPDQAAPPATGRPIPPPPSPPDRSPRRRGAA